MNSRPPAVLGTLSVLAVTIMTPARAFGQDRLIAVEPSKQVRSSDLGVFEQDGGFVIRTAHEAVGTTADPHPAAVHPVQLGHSIHLDRGLFDVRTPRMREPVHVPIKAPADARP